MKYTHTVNDNIVEIFKNNSLVDSIGPFDSYEGADSCGSTICAKYNSPEYDTIDYPNDIDFE